MTQGTPQAPAVAAPTQAPLGASLETLLQQESELADRLANLEGDRSTYQRQTRSSDVEIRTTARQQVAQLDLQIGRTETALLSVRTQITTRVPLRIPTGVPGYLGSVRRPRDGINGDNLTGIVIVFTLAVLMPISLGLTRRLWRRVPATPPAPEIPPQRLERLEHAVDAIAIEIERVSEGQRFMTKVMSERPPAAISAIKSEVAEAPALGEAKPFLALGAGPMEPIPVAQRQAVKQSITPH
jgi:hypothetical protein